MSNALICTKPVVATEIAPIEAQVAAKWWADRLREGAKQQSTSQLQRQLAPWSTEKSDMADVWKAITASHYRLSDEQLDDFEQYLATIITMRYMRDDHWNRAKSDPNWGSATRVLAVDYGPCDELRAAHQLAGGSKKGDCVFPIKTIMWISPGSVTVQYGYGASVVQLMEQS